MRLNEIFYRRYLDLGWSVIPINKASKIPAVKWQTYQDEHPTITQVSAWAQRFSGSNIAVITGPVSGIFIIDDDGSGDEAFLNRIPPTAVCKTSRGRHFYLRYPNHGTKVASKTKIRPHIDVRGLGGYAVVPPSTHSDGTAYRWLSIPEDGIADCPPDLLADILAAKGEMEFKAEEPVPRWEAVKFGVKEGERNSSAASFIGRVFRSMPEELWETAAWDAVQGWNARNEPPMDIAELRRTFESIAHKEREKRGAANDTPSPLYNLAELTDKQFPVRTFAVKNLIEQGLNLLVGKPKSGKTTLMAQIAGAVADGEPALRGSAACAAKYGVLDTTQGDVLYLALEDSEQRFFQRIRPFVSTEGMGRVDYMLHNCRSMNLGGLSDIERWITGHPKARLVVIDPLLAFMSDVPNRTNDFVRSDYKMLRPLLDIAHEHKVSILVVHHGRKGSGGNTMDALSGTLGMAAVPDTVLVIESDKIGSARLSLHSRDLENREIGLETDGHKWQLSLEVPRIKERIR